MDSNYQGGSDEQPGPSHANQGQMPAHGALTGALEGIMDPQKRQLIQQQLVLILHAQKCQRCGSQTGGAIWQCGLPNCQGMKDVLNHMTTCLNGISCTVPLCSSSRQIICHWRNCQRSDCPVCLPLRQADRYRMANTTAAAPATPANAQPNLSLSGIKRACGDLGFEYPTGSQVASTSSSTSAPGANIDQLVSVQHLQSQLQLLHFSESDRPGENSFETLAQVTARPVQGTQEWHRSVPLDLRNHFVQTLIQGIYPIPDPHAVLGSRMQHLVAYVRKVESDLFIAANSRSEYDHLFTERISKIQQHSASQHFASQ